MMPFDLQPAPKLWLSPKPAIIRALSREELLLASFLPGMFPADMLSSALTSMVLAASNTSIEVSASITAPADIRAGDILIHTDWAANVSAPTTVLPSGFTTLTNNTNGAGLRAIWSYKLALGNEGGTSLTGMAGAGGVGNKVIAVFRGNRPVKGITVSSNVASGFVNTNPAAQTILSGSLAGPVFVIAAYTANTAITSNTFTQGGSPAAQGTLNPAANNIHALAWKLFPTYTTGVNIVADQDDEGDNNQVYGAAMSLLAA